jgi:hypothetical protein
MAKQPRKRFTNKKGRIDWNQRENVLPVHVAMQVYPFHAKVLAQMYGMSTSAIYYRLRQHGVSLRDLRNGDCGKGKEIAESYVATKVSAQIVKKAATDHVTHFKTT